MRSNLRYLASFVAIAAGFGSFTSVASAESIATGSQLNLAGLVSCTSSDCAFGQSSTLNGTGSFSAFGYGDPASFSSLAFGSFTPQKIYGATNSLGQVASFYATSLTSSSTTSPTGFNNYSFAFSGIASLTGFDDTPGIFDLTTNQVGGSLGSFSATTLASAAPEPATWLSLILGFGVIGVALRSRKPRSIAAFT